MPFCFGELKRLLKVREGNDNPHLAFISYCKKCASVLENLLPNSLYPFPVLEAEVWNFGVKVAVNHCCTFWSSADTVWF